ncbi:hypothetical protein Dsin_000607 [Dipteronia sinensis]|uniref:PB1-like domain-containing protein n=1 Tax=Dipteronia sinensis TaxID=43782 RepID=A0AAE0EHP0_9ROSI|nr:hypothetical protein Dsin_000607 [Dipteronia sinensis]
MVRARKNGEEQPQYDPDVTEDLFNFRVHHGGEFNGNMDNYIGGTLSYFDYVSLDELSLLDLDDITIELEYKLPVGYWIKVEGHREPYNIGNDQQLMSYELTDNEENHADVDNRENVGDVNGAENDAYEHGLASIDKHRPIMLMSMGQLVKRLILTGIWVDPNNQMFPVAYALVEYECKDTWSWFLSSWLMIWESTTLLVLFGLVTSIKWMGTMRSKSQAVYDWLVDKDPKHWSKAFFKDTALCGMVCNNMCEAFTATILTARDKPAITMMGMIRNYLMTRLDRKMPKLEKWNNQI